MKTDFDVVIVGSGPAGISAAFPLVKSGLRVLMVDGGKGKTLPTPDRDFLKTREEDRDQWKWIIGKDYYALKQRQAVSPKLRLPIHQYVFENFQEENKIIANDVTAIGSLAVGGLSNAWGGGIACLSSSELMNFPVDADTFLKSYERVSLRIGVSGKEDDVLKGYFGLDEWAQEPVKLDSNHEYLVRQYAKHKNLFAAKGFRLGRTRLALLTKDHAHRQSCDNVGNCHWGCHAKAIYSAVDELPDLEKFDNFSYKAGVIVQKLERVDNCWKVCGKEASNINQAILTSKVILAAGTLASTRLAFQTLNFRESVSLLSCPSAAFLLWLPRFLGSSRQTGFAGGQLAHTLDVDTKTKVYGGTFASWGFPVSELIPHLPFSRPFGIDLLRGLLSSCVIGNLFLPSYLSNIIVTLDNENALRVTGGYTDKLKPMLKKTISKFRNAYGKLGALLLPGSCSLGRPGGDIHYSGTMPMSNRPELGQTDKYGEIFGLKGVYAVDGTCLPSLNSKPHTLTIMANADRIGHEISSK